jgi:hypothetical protein
MRKSKIKKNMEEHVDASIAPKMVAHPQRNEDESEPMKMHENKGVSEDEHVNTPIQELRRSTRVSRPTQKYSHSLFYTLLMNAGEPESFQKVIYCLKKVKWLETMKDEMNSLHLNET